MKKAFRTAAVILFSAFIAVTVFSVCASAKTSDETISEQREKYGVNDLERSVGEKGITTENSKEKLTFSEILSEIGESVKEVFFPKLRLLYRAFAVLALMYVCESLGSEKTKLGGVTGYIAVAVCAAVVFSDAFDTAKTVCTGLEEVVSFLGSLGVVAAATAGAAGEVTSAEVSGGALALASYALSFVVSVCIMPLTNAFVAVGTVSGLTDNARLKSFSAALRTVIIVTVGLAATLFVGIASVRMGASYAADSLAKRTVRLAAGSFVPIAGGAISESVDAVFLCAAALKGSVGLFGTAVTVFTLLTPIVSVASSFIVMTIACAMCSFFGNEPMNAFFSVVRDAFSVLFAVTAFSATAIIITLSLII